MDNSHIECTGILLAGGISRRMGQDKGHMKLGGHMMYRYALAALEKTCSEVLISSDRDLPGSENFIRVGDVYQNCGPLGGIHACLKQSKTELNLVLAYDMPLVSAALLKYLLDHSAKAKLVLPIKDANPEPLCGVYSKSLLPFIEEQLEKEEYALHQLLEKAQSFLLPVEAGMPFFKDDLFLNLNQPEDLEAWDHKEES